jgi:hypothetical protein
MSLSNDYAASQLRNPQIPTFARFSAFPLRSATFSSISYYLLIQERIPELNAGFFFRCWLGPTALETPCSLDLFDSGAACKLSDLQSWPADPLDRSAHTAFGV